MRLLQGSYDKKHFDPWLLESIRIREDTEAIEFIQDAALMYNPSKLTDNSGSTLLHHAAREGNEVITTYLISLGFNVNTPDICGRTPLLLAVLGNHISTTEILLYANSDIHVKTGNGKSLVQSIFDRTIACYNHILEMFVYKLMSEHADVKLLAMALIDAKCPLYYVMDLRSPDITKIMLEHGCAVNARESRHGNTALHRAVYFKDVENIKLLLAHGVDVNVKDNGGKIAWRCAPDFDGSIVQLKVLKMLLAKKPLLTKLTTDGRMQMYELFVRGNEEAVKMILQSGIDVSGKDSKGDTVFHYLAMNRNLTGSKLLPYGSYDMNSRNHLGLTALHVAAINGNVGATVFLLNNGAHVDTTTKNTGFTPLLCTIKALSDVKVNRCAELLLQRGADAQFVSQTNKTVFDVLQDRNFFVMRPILAHLAILEARDTPILQVIRKKIDNCQEYKSQFSSFKQQLERMKSDKVHDSITLFQLLADRKQNIEKYVRSKELKLKLKSQNNNNYSFDPYFSSMLRKRVNRAMKIIELFE